MRAVGPGVGASHGAASGRRDPPASHPRRCRRTRSATGIAAAPLRCGLQRGGPGAPSPRAMRGVLVWTGPRCVSSERLDRAEAHCQRDGCRRARRKRPAGRSSLPANATRAEELISRRIWRTTRMADGDRGCSSRLGRCAPLVLPRQPLRPKRMGSDLDPMRPECGVVRLAPWSVGIGFAATGCGAWWWCLSRAPAKSREWGRQSRASRSGRGAGGAAVFLAESQP